MQRAILKPTMVGKTQKRRIEIISVARRLFLEAGYGGVSMDEIKNKAGISKGGLYHYFPTKESLLKDVVRSITVEVVKLLYVDLERSMLRGPMLAQFLFDQQNTYKESYVELFGHLLVNEPEESARMIIRSLWSAYIPTFELLLRRLETVPEGQTHECANIVATLISELTMRISVTESELVPSIVRVYEDAVSGALGLGNCGLILVPPGRIAVIRSVAEKIR
jgi:AcrR family transcriptional regulator